MHLAATDRSIARTNQDRNSLLSVRSFLPQSTEEGNLGVRGRARVKRVEVRLLDEACDWTTFAERHAAGAGRAVEAASAAEIRAVR